MPAAQTPAPAGWAPGDLMPAMSCPLSHPVRPAPLRAAAPVPRP